MPTYEYRCPDGTIVEKIFKMSEAPAEIPSPNGDGMAQRIISGGAALLFKGSGFYITDYGKDGKKDQRAASGEKSGSKDSDSAASSAKGESATGTAAATPAPASAPASPPSAPPKKD